MALRRQAGSTDGIETREGSSVYVEVVGSGGNGWMISWGDQPCQTKAMAGQSGGKLLAQRKRTHDEGRQVTGEGVGSEEDEEVQGRRRAKEEEGGGGRRREEKGGSKGIAVGNMPNNRSEHTSACSPIFTFVSILSSSSLPGISPSCDPLHQSLGSEKFG
eukprot:3232345-Rhodomonas_salina.2